MERCFGEPRHCGDFVVLSVIILGSVSAGLVEHICRKGLREFHSPLIVYGSPLAISLSKAVQLLVSSSSKGSFPWAGALFRFRKVWLSRKIRQSAAQPGPMIGTQPPLSIRNRIPQTADQLQNWISTRSCRLS
jgi:hypothetical protein